ncbi:putative IQ domain-containing protein IQM [Dioscorea sansibarensis]
MPVTCLLPRHPLPFVFSFLHLRFSPFCHLQTWIGFGMGITFTCPGADAFDEGIESLIVRSLSFNGDNEKSSLRSSFSFNANDSDSSSILRALGSGKLIIEGSVDFEKKEMDISIKSPKTEEDSPKSDGLKNSGLRLINDNLPQTLLAQPHEPKHLAAVKLQKVYKSFRTRRQLADCAVLVEQRWWKLLDFALLRRSSISFFDIEKQETAVSRWARARTKAAKVGKGLLKNEKARKLALQHWLEAIDPRHRYGHNLHFYYASWLQCESRQPFFYWLDVGEGKEVNLEERCSRSKLQQQCIKYLGPKEREAYEVKIEDGKFYYKSSRQLLDTTQSSKETKWIFVLSTSKDMYVGQKKKGVFQHSSFLAGGATSAAGRLVVENGSLKAVWPHSGHYRPTEENFQEFMSFLKEHNVDLTDVKKSPVEDDDESGLSLRCNTGLATNGSREDLTEKTQATEGLTNIETPPQVLNSCSHLETSMMKHNVEKQAANGESSDDEEETSIKTNSKTHFKRPRILKIGNSVIAKDEEDESMASYMLCKDNLFMEESAEDEHVAVPQDWILRRIDSRRGAKSYQLGKQLSFKWTTGAGPRIGCVRDYPSELQVLALEQVSLSPRETGKSRSCCASPLIPASPCTKKSQVPSTKDDTL